MPLAPTVALLTYSVPLRQARPATKFGDPGSLVAWGPLSRYTPPLGTFDDSAPPSPSNTLPPPNANDVGVLTPSATCVTLAPLAPVGGGGGPPAAVALATTPPVVTAAVAAINAAVRPRIAYSFRL